MHDRRDQFVGSWSLDRGYRRRVGIVEAPGERLAGPSRSWWLNDERRTTSHSPSSHVRFRSWARALGSLRRDAARRQLVRSHSLAHFKLPPGRAICRPKDPISAKPRSRRRAETKPLARPAGLSQRGDFREAFGYLYTGGKGQLTKCSNQPHAH